MHTLLALGTFLGTVIGVGVFGLPYLAAQMGLLPLIVLFCVLMPLVLLVHLRFVDVVAGTKGRHRIPGYVHQYLGSRWRNVSLVVSILGIVGSLLAYLTVGGIYTHMLLKPVLEIPPIYALGIFFLATNLFLIRGTKGVAWVDTLLIGVFFVIVAIFFFFAFPKLTQLFTNTHDWSAMPMGYGVVLFSLWGLTLIPETVELVKKKHAIASRVVTIGLCAAALTYIVFTVMVYGVTGAETTPDALTGFLSRFPPIFLVIGGAFGVVTTFTSYVALGMTLTKMLSYDLHINLWVSRLFTIGFPVALYGIGLKNFIDVIGLTGAVLLGFEGALVIAVTERFRLVHHGGGSRALHITLIVALLCGVGVELWSFFW